MRKDSAASRNAGLRMPRWRSRSGTRRPSKMNSANAGWVKVSSPKDSLRWSHAIAAPRSLDSTSLSCTDVSLPALQSCGMRQVGFRRAARRVWRRYGRDPGRTHHASRRRSERPSPARPCMHRARDPDRPRHARAFAVRGSRARGGHPWWLRRRRADAGVSRLRSPWGGLWG